MLLNAVNDLSKNDFESLNLLGHASLVNNIQSKQLKENLNDWSDFGC